MNPRRQLIALAFAAYTTLAGVCAYADRVPPPTPQQVVDEGKAIDETYQQQLARPGQADRIQLATQMLNDANSTGSDSAAMYVLLCKARDLAAGAGDLQTAGKCCDALSANFLVSPGAVRVAMYQHAMGAMFSHDDFSAYVASALESTDLSLKYDDFASAQQLLKLAWTASPKTHNMRLGAMTNRHQQFAAAQQNAFVAMQPSFTALQANPNDPNANTAVGRYVCFYNDDWERGLPLLARGANVPLATLAQQDLGAPLEPEAQAAIGNGWYDFSQQASAPEKLHILRRAQYWLDMALPHLSGYHAERAKERLGMLEPILAEYYDWGEIWGAVRTALHRHCAVATDIVGGAFGHEPYQEIPPGGGVLVGFRIGLIKLGSNNCAISLLRSMYLTSQGICLGDPRGIVEDGPCFDVQARPGYAVGAIEVHGGGGLDSITLTFMKIVGDHLDPTQKYISDHIGGSGGGGGRVLDGCGVPIVGILGKIDNRNHAAGLGVIFMTTPPNGDNDKFRQSNRQELNLTPVQ